MTICFVGDGTRPFDSPNGYHPHEFPFSKHKTSCSMRIIDLCRALGCPEGPQNGVTEMISLGNDMFAEGDSYTQGGGSSERTLRQVGWTNQRGEENPVWLVKKR